MTKNEIKSKLEVLKDWVGNDSLTRQDMQNAIDEAIQALEKPPQIVEILEGDLLIIKTDTLLHPEHLYKLRQDVKKQKESGVLVLDARFDYTIVKMNKEDKT